MKKTIFTLILILTLVFLTSCADMNLQNNETESTTEPIEDLQDFSLYDSGSLVLEQRTTITPDEIRQMIEECKQIYAQYGQIKLARFDNKQKLILEKRAFAAQMNQNVENYGDTYLSGYGMTHDEVVAWATKGFVHTPNSNVLAKNYTAVTLEQFNQEYEEIIASILIDKLVGMFPQENIEYLHYNFTNSGNYGVRITLTDMESDGNENTVMLRFNEFPNIRFVVLFRNGLENTTDTIYIVEEDEFNMVSSLAFREQPLESDYSGNVSAYQKAQQEYSEWQKRAEEYNKKQS